MSLLDYFKSNRKSSASIAKERLQIVVAHERSVRNSPSYLPMLRNEILAVIRKYVAVEEDAISVHLEQNDHHEILELNVILPDVEESKQVNLK